MKVVYSVATRLNGGGIGTTADQAVRGILVAGYLKRVFCSSKAATEIPGNLIFSTNSSFFERLRFLPSHHRWLVKDLVHDLVVSTTLLCSNVVTRGREKFDIFHVWNGHGLYSLPQARKMGARIVVERASSHPLTYERIMNRELGIRGLRPQSLMVINKKRLLTELAEADFMAVPSEFSYQSMIESGIPAEKLVKIPFGVDSNRFRPLVEKKAQAAFEVLFAGQVGLRKGVLYLLEAWTKLNLREARLTIVGQPDAEIGTFLREFENDRSIRFLGYRDLLPLYQSADLFVLPSLEEGSALVTYEALACGLPVVTTFEAGSVVEDRQEGLIVPSRNAEALCGAIKKVYEDSVLRKALSNRARIRAQSYSWERYGQNLVDFYRRIV